MLVTPPMMSNPSTTTTTTTTRLAESSWQAGHDVSSDFQRLQQAIRYTQKDQHLQFLQRQHVLRHFPTQQRQLWRPFFRKKIVVPFMAGTFLSFGPHRWFYPWLLRLQFFSCVVVPPLVLLLLLPLLRRNKRDHRVNDVSDMRTCLLEQWTTAVWGAFLLWGGSISSTNSRIVIRLAAWCSIHQFPRLLYELQETPRPVDGLSYILQKILPTLGSPWWWAAELGCSGLLTPTVTVGIMSALLLAYLYPSLVQHRNVIVKSFVLGIVGRYYLWNQKETLWYAVQWLATFQSIEKNPMALLASFGNLIWPWMVSAIALLGPWLHLVAFSKLIEVKLIHNVSSDMNVEEMEAALAKPPNWYYSLKWREPQRMRHVLRAAKDRFMYNFLFAGSVPEKMRQESRKIVRQQELNGNRIWERITFSDATQWKENAMQRMSNQHRYDYERGKYEDPLGVAVYKTLGIGLGFNFDHMNESSDIPETRRLQARAAKSAVRHVQDLYGLSAEVLKQLPDGEEKIQKTMELKHQIEQETESLAKQLSELIPTDRALRLNDVKLEMYSREYKKVSSTEMVLVEQEPSPSSSPVSQRLLESMKTNHQSDYDDMEEWERQMTLLFDDADGDDTMKTYMA
ncbi:hypothetical protein FisN_16Lh086 [Fistulifera solaris]|uniref:Uncharacterized protein n=1 Tax=Fistulifera solaris TaxID=1519565 RepID=A0A1Z5KJ28_FISSO|nr:hypothetical protein FisN_16Lh086 [Fistulifera solaris]|eukprot:GAX26256.1 hypothetical protein FisN_16Lh086 [Fistulifera solaris]